MPHGLVKEVTEMGYKLYTIPQQNTSTGTYIWGPQVKKVDIKAKFCNTLILEIYIFVWCNFEKNQFGVQNLKTQPWTSFDLNVLKNL